jgi:biopolymer transport protein ExbB/TolQ
MSEFHQLLTTVIGVAMAIIAVLGFNEKRKDRKARNF